MLGLEASQQAWEAYRDVECQTVGVFAGHATPALAWGDMGHPIICETAFQELEPAARERMGLKVDAILMQNAVFDSAKISGIRALSLMRSHASRCLPPY